LLGGRLTVNIISSDLPGQALESGPRYRRTLEYMRVLRDVLNGRRVDCHGEFFDAALDPPRLGLAGDSCPPFYFGGLSEADEHGYAEPNLWTGIGRARSGAGAAIVGDPDQVLAKLHDYTELGLEAFILSGYPHAAEADLFARHVLPYLDHGPLFRRP
jgi:alkanesulfonate monooxygenase SsuD/methylene tetrahydromethanopterin reductase-like flavin-dependent oxidoreductase (luciferase family)